MKPIYEACKCNSSQRGGMNKRMMKPIYEACKCHSSQRGRINKEMMKPNLRLGSAIRHKIRPIDTLVIH